jgi:hypothetical protein
MIEALVEMMIVSSQRLWTSKELHGIVRTAKPTWSESKVHGTVVALMKDTRITTRRVSSHKTYISYKGVL